MSIPVDLSYYYCGRLFTAEEIDWIRNLIISNPQYHRLELSRKVCHQFQWLSANGNLKDMSCRVAMLRMHRDGLICLPSPLKKMVMAKLVFNYLMPLIHKNQYLRPPVNWANSFYIQSPIPKRLLSGMNLSNAIITSVTSPCQALKSSILSFLIQVVSWRLSASEPLPGKLLLAITSLVGTSSNDNRIFI